MMLSRIAVKEPSNKQLKPGAREQMTKRVMAAYPHFAHNFFSQARQQRLLSRAGGEILVRTYDIATELCACLLKAGYRVDFDHVAHHGMCLLNVTANLTTENYWVHSEAQDILMQGLPKSLIGYTARRLVTVGGQTICPDFATAHSLAQELIAIGYTCRVDMEKISL